MQLNEILDAAHGYAKDAGDTALMEAIEEKQDKTIHIEWHIEDVQNVDDRLDDEQAMDVLEGLKNNHDANIGINWDVISYAID